MTLDFTAGVSNVFRAEKESETKRIIRLPIAELHQHPQLHVAVAEDSYLDELTESVKKNGILEEPRVFPDPAGGYWIISGRHRVAAAKRAEMDELDCIIDDNMTKETAEIAITDSNLRHELSPMEKAWTLRIKHEAEVKKESDKADRAESDATMFRYIRLTYLIQDLQDRTELKGKAQLKVRTGAALSYLSEDLQHVVNDCIENTGKLPDMTTAEDWSRQKDTITAAAITAWFEKKPPAKKKPKKFSMPFETVSAFVPEEYSQGEIENLVVQLLKEWQENNRPLTGGQ